MTSWMATAREAARNPVVRAELRTEARGLLRNGEPGAARRIFEDILQEPTPASPFFQSSAPGGVCRTDEGMYLHFADHPYETSHEFASGFIVDYSPKSEIIGLEILLSEHKRASLAEEPLLAFGVFGAALVWVGYHYAAHSGAKMRGATLRKAEEFVSAAGLGLQVAAYASNGLTIADADGKALLYADMQYHPRHILKSASAPKSAEDSYLPADGMAEIRAAIKHLTETALPANPGAIGVAVAVDELYNPRCRQAVEPGRWTEWPVASGKTGAHIAILPPQGCVYPWLPEHFLDFPV